jgi:hypothetical protein
MPKTQENHDQAPQHPKPQIREEEGSASKHYACNGKEGSPWTAKGTLPKGSSERGQWAMSGTGPTIVYAAISFPIPLAAPLGENSVHFIGKEEGFKEPKEATAIKNEECTGTWEKPGAATGNLCIFVNPTQELGEPNPLGVEDGEAKAGPKGAGVSGAHLGEEDAKTGLFLYGGSWVVTG